MPKIVGETDDGEPIFEIRSVRLLLRGDASHFNRIAACSKCQRDVPGPPVLSRAALDDQLNPLICSGCVPASAIAYATTRTEVRTPPLPVAAWAPAPGPLQNGHSSPSHVETVVLDGRQVELTSLLRTHGVELKTELDVRARNTQTELRGDLAYAIERLGLSEADPGPTQILERRMEALEAAATEDSGGLRSGVARHVPGNDTLAGAQPELGGLLIEPAELVAQNAVPPERLQAMEDQLRQLQLLVEAEVARAHAESAIREQGDLIVLRIEQQLDERLKCLAEQAERTSDADRQARLAIEQRVEETIERRTAGVEAQQSELRTAVETDLEHLRAVVRHNVGQAGADMVQVMLENEQLRRSHEALVQHLDRLAKHVQELQGSVEASNARNEDQGGAQAGLSRRLDEVVELVQRLQASLDSNTARAHLDSATVAQINVELVRIEAQFNQRLDRLVERAVRTDDLQADRLRSLGEQAQEALARIGEALESHCQVLQSGLRQGLVDVRSSILAREMASDPRVQALEERLQQSDYEMSELGELHTVLDIGLGTLRSEIAEVRRSAVTMVADSHADIQDRLGEFRRLQQAALTRQRRSRKLGRKTESGLHLAVAIEAAEILAREHHQLKAQVAMLELEADAATARAASDASATSSLKSDILLLWEQLAAQNDALGTLGRAVERLRRRPPPKPGRRAPTG